MAVFLAGQFLLATSRIWFARMGVSVAPVPPSDVAAFAFGGRAGDRRRRGPSPGQSHREPGPRHALIAIASIEVAATLLLLPWAWGDFSRAHS